MVAGKHFPQPRKLLRSTENGFVLLERILCCPRVDYTCGKTFYSGWKIFSAIRKTSTVTMNMDSDSCKTCSINRKWIP